MKKRVVPVVILALILLGGTFAALRWKPSQWRDVFVMPFHKDEKTAVLRLKKGQPLKAFAQQALEKGLVVDSKNFLYWLSKKKADRSLRSGSYKVTSGPTWYVAEQLKNAEPAFYSAVIVPGAPPEKPLSLGSQAQQIAALSDDANFPEAMRPILPKSAEARAAFLLPETYALVEDSVEELIFQAADEWHKKFGAMAGDKAYALRSAIIASLLQREALKSEEYPVIAGVIENRLAKKMLLQIDASVVYAWRRLTGETLTRVLYKHLEVDSPYNTYKHPGLPPSPICVPSEAAWQGALAPQKNDYYYYVAKGDGYHQFSKTQKEHQAAVRAYRK